MTVDREKLREEMARLGFNGWYGRDEYDEFPVQGMWERTADAQLAGPLLSALLAQADSAERMEAERDEARSEHGRLTRVLDFEKRAHRVQKKRADRLSAEVAALRAALDAAEACLSIVEPRTDRAEYMRTLDVVRTALTRTTDQPDPGAREGSSLPVEAAEEETDA